MIDAFEVVFCQHKARMPVQTAMKKSMFRRPTLSAVMPGMTRPKKDAPLSIAVR